MHIRIKNIFFCFILSFIALINIGCSTQPMSQWPKDEVALLDKNNTKNLLINSIDEANSSIKLCMYKLTDKEIINAFIRAAKRNVTVKIILANNPFVHTGHVASDDEASLKELEKLKNSPNVTIKAQGVPSHPEGQGHYKLLIIDQKYALILTFNLENTSFLETLRDFIYKVENTGSDKANFVALCQMFDNHFKEKSLDSSAVPNSLIIGPDGQKEFFIHLFAKAKRSIKIYQQSFNDPDILKKLIELIRQGIEVKLIMTPFPFNDKKDDNWEYQKRLVQAGGKIRFSLKSDRYIHAKVVIIDDTEAYLGSCNFYPKSLEHNRELGIVITDNLSLKKLLNVFNKDWGVGLAIGRKPIVNKS